MVGHPMTFIPVDGKETCRVLDLGCGEHRVFLSAYDAA
jgi:hypothetical protein